MTAGELRALASLVGELGSSNFQGAVAANFGSFPDDAEVALDVVSILIPPAAPFAIAAGALLELASYLAASGKLHIAPDPLPMTDAQTGGSAAR